MQALKAVYINEIFKISKRKKVTAAAVLSLISVVIAAIAVHTLNNFAGIRVTGSSEFSIMVLTVLSYTLFPLFTAFICIDMFAGEFVDNTIKSTLTCPASRFKIFMGKILAIASFILANLLFVMLLSIIASLFIDGSSLNIIRIFFAYIMAFFPIFVYSMLVVLISNFTKGTTSAFMLSVLVFLIFLGLGVAFPHLKSFLFTSGLNWFVLILGSYLNFSKLFRIFLIFLGYVIMLFGAGYYFFEKRDI
jgi:ABC-2 type transport system permease protein